MSSPIAVQLYTLREQADKDPVAVLKALADKGYVGVETAGLYGKKPAEFRKLLDDHGLVACSGHLPIFGDGGLEKIVEEAQTIGYREVVAGCGGGSFETDDAIKACAEKINKAVEYLESNGLRVHYHNHDWEWVEPRKGHRLLELCPRIYPQFDIYWLAVAGVDPAKIIKRYADRCILMHVKDGPCDRHKAMTAVGQGKVDIKSAVEAGDQAGVEWLIVELDRCDTDMLQAVKDSYDYLVGNGWAQGNK